MVNQSEGAQWGFVARLLTLNPMDDCSCCFWWSHFGKVVICQVNFHQDIALPRAKDKVLKVLKVLDWEMSPAIVPVDHGSRYAGCPVPEVHIHM